jgi:Big-like domain-containing protein
VKFLLFAVVVAVAVACGDSSGPGKQATSVTGIAGDSQLAPTGAQLAFPLSLTALGSNGQPVQGVNVTWTVTPAGRATFNPASSPTDVNGVASTTVTTGATAGEITIQANVPGVSSAVVYHALVLDPCAFAASYTVGQTVNGRLSTSDCNFQSQGWYYDFYALNLPTGQNSLRISMLSDTFDTYVDLFRADGPHFGFDDDVVLGQQQNSQLDIILPGDNYIIGANSFDRFSTGPYQLTATPRAAAMNGCRQVWVARGISVDDSITATDCADSAAQVHHYDVARIVAFSGTVLTLSSTSATINPALALYQLNPGTYARTLLMSNDDSAGTTTKAFIQYAVPASGYFDIIITTSAGGETGAYTFAVSSSTTFSPLRPTPVSRVRPGWRGSVSLPTDALHLFHRAKL